MAEKKRKEKEAKVQAELEKRKQREINFQHWLQRKKEERSSSGYSSSGSSGSCTTNARPGSVSPTKSRRCPLKAKDPFTAEESFKVYNHYNVWLLFVFSSFFFNLQIFQFSSQFMIQFVPPHGQLESRI